MGEPKNVIEYEMEGFDLKAAYTALVEGYVELRLRQINRRKKGKKDGTPTTVQATDKT